MENSSRGKKLNKYCPQTKATTFGQKEGLEFLREVRQAWEKAWRAWSWELYGGGKGSEGLLRYCQCNWPFLLPRPSIGPYTYSAWEVRLYCMYEYTERVGHILVSSPSQLSLGDTPVPRNEPKQNVTEAKHLICKKTHWHWQHIPQDKRPLDKNKTKCT